MYSSLGYGFLWNLPSTGQCELTRNHTRWTSDSTEQIDYVVIAGNPREVSNMLADLTGHAPVMPHWASGFWQSRLRYETQDEVLSVAQKYKEFWEEDTQGITEESEKFFVTQQRLLESFLTAIQVEMAAF